MYATDFYMCIDLCKIVSNLSGAENLNWSCYVNLGCSIPFDQRDKLVAKLAVEPLLAAAWQRNLERSCVDFEFNIIN